MGLGQLELAPRPNYSCHETKERHLKSGWNQPNLTWSPESARGSFYRQKPPIKTVFGLVLEIEVAFLLRQQGLG